jgi:hypothetical protein
MSFQVTSQDSLKHRTELFYGTDYLELIIITNIDSLLHDIGDDPSYHDARISYKNEDSLWIELNAEVRVRGNFRKQPTNCDFPPLRLKFEKEERENTIFENTKNIKMVTHCQTNIPDYEQYVMQEFLIYKLYNILSDFSFEVRLLKVTYLDTRDSDYRIEKYAFFIEDDDDMADRYNGNILEIETVDPNDVDQEYYLLVSFFEYLIINTDWSLPIVHNIILLSTDYFEPPLPVPFDFDWSGLINIPYEIPTASGLKTRIPERIFKGPCVKNRELKKITRLFKSKKNEIFDLYYNFLYLDHEYKAETLRNIQIFYEILDDQFIFNYVFKEQCVH